MRAPNFMQGVVSKPSQPARFGSMSTTPPPPPAAKAPAVPAHPERSDDEAVAASKVIPFPSPPVGVPAALSEFRPAPTPPRPSPDSAALGYAIEKLGMQNERLAELARSDALEVGFLVAERILEQEISQNPRALINLVRSAMRRLAESRQITVTLSAADHERIKAAPDNGLASVKLEIDPAFGPGDCKVSSELGVVDGRVQTRLAELRKSIESSEGDE